MTADHPLFERDEGDEVPTRAVAPARPASQLPEPGRFSIRYTPRRSGRHRWPIAPGPWLDLASGRAHGVEDWGMGHADDPETDSPGEALPPLDTGEVLDDVLYLPPVPLALAANRDALAHRLRERGTPVRVHRFPGTAATAVISEAHPDDVFDLLPALLADDASALARVPVGALIAWPLIPGVTDDPELQEAGCQVLAERGAAAVQGVVAELSPADRRALLERRGDELFDTLFHGPPPQVRDLARHARRNGLGVFAPRPLPRPPALPAARIENRRLAGGLALAAELADRLGHAPAAVQELFRAAREADRTHYDLTALAREGNLGVLDWLGDDALELVRASVAGEGRPGEGPLAPYLDAYAGPPVS